MKGTVHVITPAPSTVRCTNCGTETNKVARFKGQPYSYLDRYSPYASVTERVPYCDLCIECLTIGLERVR